MSWPVSARELRGAVGLMTDAALGVADVTEAMHLAVLRTLGLRGSPRGGAGGITGLVYRSVRAVTRGVGAAADAGLRALEPADAQAARATVPLALRSVLNGVVGDRLLARDNPLALPMTLHLRDSELDVLDAMAARAGGVGSRIVVLVHGLCMNDLQWAPRDAAGTDLGRALEADGHEVVHVRYNTGLNVWRNGRELSTRLDAVLAKWPTPVDAVSVVGHSMGGLVIRSALLDAEHRGATWQQRVRAAVYLGTPHHGAPLERAGNVLERLIEASPYSAPLARIGRVRSAGITDLRHGRVTEPPAARDDGSDVPARAPRGVAQLAIAATSAARRGLLADRLWGDGLVPLHSALGRHADPARSLAFDGEHIVYRTGHLGLLHSAEVARHVMQWLRVHAGTRRPRSGR